MLRAAYHRWQWGSVIYHKVPFIRMCWISHVICWYCTEREKHSVVYGHRSCRWAVCGHAGMAKVQHTKSKPTASMVGCSKASMSPLAEPWLSIRTTCPALHGENSGGCPAGLGKDRIHSYQCRNCPMKPNPLIFQRFI